jgi:RNA polymerase II elongation factor ELL
MLLECFCVIIITLSSSQCLSSIGVMSHNLRVQATDDVYQTTKEKISLAEEESKKARLVICWAVCFCVLEVFLMTFVC